MESVSDYYESISVSAMNGQPVSRSRMLAAGGGDFLSGFNQELAAAGVSPVSASATGRNRNFRSLSGNTTSLEQQDLASLRNALKKKGLTDDDLSALDHVLDNAENLTIGTLMGALAGQGRVADDLSEEEIGHLHSALRSMGFNQEEAEEIYGLMQNGHQELALAKINKQIDSLGDEARAKLNRDEIKALAKALELSKDTGKVMLKQLNGADDAEFSREGLNALLAGANDELARRKESLNAIVDHLDGAIDEMLQARRIRKAIEPVSDTRGSRRAERAETRMRDDLSATGRALGPSGEYGLSSDDEINDSIQEENARQNMDERRGREREMRDEPGKAQVRAEAGSKRAAQEQSATRNTRTASTLEARLTGEGLFNPMTNTSSSPEQLAARRAAFEQSVFTQVEKGMLQQLKDGSHRLTLQLNPDDMGTVTVLLTVRGNEVRATLRADSEETASALTQQLSQLRHSLEEQGLKVTELEVETALTQDFASREWSGTESYNQQQQLREQVRLLQLARLRREAGNDLARNMQDTSVSRADTAQISASGLHIVA